MTQPAHSGSAWVGASPSTNNDEVHAQFDRVTDPGFPQVASLLDDDPTSGTFALEEVVQQAQERSTRRSGDAPMWWASSLTGQPCAASLAPSWLSSTTNGPLAVDTSHLSC